MSEEYMNSRCVLAGGALYKLICHQVPNDWDIFISPDAKIGLADLMDEINEMDEFGGIIHDFIFQKPEDQPDAENPYDESEVQSLKFKWKDQIINFIVPNYGLGVRTFSGSNEERIELSSVSGLVNDFPINRQRFCSPLTLDFMACTNSATDDVIVSDYDFPKVEQYKKNEAETTFAGLEIICDQVSEMREARYKYVDEQRATQKKLFHAERIASQKWFATPFITDKEF